MEMLHTLPLGSLAAGFLHFLLFLLHCVLHKSQIVSLVHCFVLLTTWIRSFEGFSWSFLLPKLSYGQWTFEAVIKKTVKGMKLFLEVPSHLPSPSQEWKEVDVMAVPSTWQWPDMWCSMSVLKWGILRRLLTNHYKVGEEEKGILEKAYKVQDGGLRHKQLRCLLSTGSRNSHLALNPG